MTDRTVPDTQPDRIGRRTKILCTLGPSSSRPEDIDALMEAGMDVARLNFSHGDHAFFARLIADIRRVAEDRGQPIAILQDLQGPKIRVGRFDAEDGIELVPGSAFVLTTATVTGNQTRVAVSYPEFCNDVKAGDPILLDDGRLRLRVTEVRAPDVHCQVEIGGRLTNNKGINLPGSELTVPPLSRKDRADLAFGAEQGVDWVAMSFVQRPADLIALRSALTELGVDTPIIAKIEKPQAVAQISDILAHTDAIMIARGDLGVEVPAEEVPLIQKAIIRQCNAIGTPVITATQMLESMITSPTPTRAEASDVANAVLDGTDAIMLSGETANGAYPIEAVSTMSRIATLVERSMPSRWDRERTPHRQDFTAAMAIGYSACHSAELVDASAIVCLTQSGSTAAMIARFRPRVPIFALSSSLATCQTLALLWGVTSVHTRDGFTANLDETILAIQQELLDSGRLIAGEHVVFTTGLPFAERRTTNTLRIEQIAS